MTKRLLPKDFWATPQVMVDGLFDFFIEQYELYQLPTIDVAANEHNSKCDTFIDEELNTLEIDWGTDQLCWLNPPYSNIMPFVQKAVAETVNGNYTITLLRNDCSTKWFKYCVDHAAAVLFVLNGRIGFHSPFDGKSVGGNNFSSVVFFFAPGNHPLKTFYVTRQELEQRGEEA